MDQTCKDLRLENKNERMLYLLKNGPRLVKGQEKELLECLEQSSLVEELERGILFEDDMKTVDKRREAIQKLKMHLKSPEKLE